MSPLIWTLTWLLQACPAMCELAAPINVNLSSSHFIHLLTWDPGPGTPRGVVYNVTVYSLSGYSWEPVVGCEHVESPRLCNVTKVFSVHNETYYYRVVALLDSQESTPAGGEGFVPIEDTRLDPPLVRVESCGNRSLCVGLQPREDRLREVYATLLYSLNISSSTSSGMHRIHFSVDRVRLDGETLRGLAPGREYCVSVRIQDSHTNRISAYSPPHCAFIAADHTPDIEIAVVLCFLLFLCFLFIRLLVHTGFICLKRPLPEVLTSVQHQEERLISEPYDNAPLSPVCVKPPPPPVVEESEGEEEKSSTGEEGGGGYDTRLPVVVPFEHPLSPTSSLFSSSSSGAGVLPKTHPLPQLPTVPSTETNGGSGSNPSHLHLPVSVPAQPCKPPPRPDDQSTSVSDSPPPPGVPTTSRTPQLLLFPQCVLWGRDVGLLENPERDPETVEAVEPGEVEEVVGEEEEVVGEEWSDLDVNLLSVTLGGLEEKEDEAEEEVIPEVEVSPPHREELLGSTVPLLSSQPQNDEEEEEEEEDEEEEEHCGYRGWS